MELEYLLWKYGPSLPARARIRRRTIDGVVALAKSVVDRNFGMARGWIRAARELSDRPSPLGSDALEGVPLSHLSTSAGLARRLARRTR